MKTVSERGLPKALRYALVASLFFMAFSYASAAETTLVHFLDNETFQDFCASGCNTSTDAYLNNGDNLWGGGQAASPYRIWLRNSATNEYAYMHWAIPLGEDRGNLLPESIDIEIYWSAYTNNAPVTLWFSPDNVTWYEFHGYNNTNAWYDILGADNNFTDPYAKLDFLNSSDFFNIYFTANSTAVTSGLAITGLQVKADVFYNSSERQISNCTNPDHQRAVAFNGFDEAWSTGAVNYTIDNIQFDYELTNGTDRSMALAYGYNITQWVCVWPGEENFTTDMQAQYVADDYSARHWYFNDARLQNVTEAVSLYLINDTLDDQIAIHVRDESLNNKEGAEVRVMRWIPPTYTTSTILVTNSEGKAYVYLQKDEWYKFQVLYNGTVYKTTDATQLVGYDTSTAYVIDVSFGDAVPYLNWISGIGYSIISDTTPIPTRYTLIVTDPSGLAATAYVTITSANTTESVTYCDETDTGTSISINCVTSGYPDGVYIAESYLKMDDGSYYLLDARIHELGEPATQLPNDGLIMSIVFVGTIGFVGLIHPVLAILMTVVGLAATAILQISLISWSSIISILGVGIVIMYLIGRGGQNK